AEDELAPLVYDKHPLTVQPHGIGSGARGLRFAAQHKHAVGAERRQGRGFKKIASIHERLWCLFKVWFSVAESWAAWAITAGMRASAPERGDGAASRIVRT